MRIGTVKSAWRYPVKSILGEELEVVRMDESGIAGDRARVIVDAEAGRFATADLVRRWPNLFALRAEGEGEGVRVTLPDGRTVAADDAATLSKILGRPVRVSALGAPYQAEAPVHLVATSTLERLDVDPRRFRPNLVVDTDADESAWVGRTLELGDGVRLAVDGRCVRCVMTTLAQDELARDPSVLRRIVRENDRAVGVYAVVERDGMVRRGDPVRLA
jgi:hypothetical protein